MQPQLRGQTLALVKPADGHWIRRVFGFFPPSKNIRKLKILTKYLNERNFFSIKSNKGMNVDPWTTVEKKFICMLETSKSCCPDANREKCGVRGKSWAPPWQSQISNKSGIRKVWRIQIIWTNSTQNCNCIRTSDVLLSDKKPEGTPVGTAWEIPGSECTVPSWEFWPRPPSWSPCHSSVCAQADTTGPAYKSPKHHTSPSAEGPSVTCLRKRISWNRLWTGISLADFLKYC